MSKLKIGDVCADMGEIPGADGKHRYVKIGQAFANERSQISFVLDMVPVGRGWNGWCNVFADTKPKPDRSYPAPPPAPPFDGDDRDIPF